MSSLIRSRNRALGEGNVEALVDLPTLVYYDGVGGKVEERGGGGREKDRKFRDGFAVLFHSFLLSHSSVVFPVVVVLYVWHCARVIVLG